ncbi:SDR family oxidoreductase [Streptomyces capillispiralis]|uniref:NAD(P)-dependent dehydrogenase (Short-subunit alcohol dehydrogenase family) n=1 Tax=Streptomyces capillispiralis TaxID=68182 RepID=A0A561TS50_9ACTN|nr:SDR family oxidoreductase [Streptomyces capillispiralis]TWF89928.1 NAD(P)-dependent dehydrogenase (short-subunit alcohol dehydrogenase family) [Streptomyces capillispiralis]GHH95757.1 oxidoreductase [Streptomyces capillispiralis]
MAKLSGKVAVITGATSGLALATAKLFVAEGAHVVITGRRQEQLDAAVAAIGHEVTGVVGDVGEVAHVVRLADVVAAELGRVDVLVASAGAWTWNERIGDVTEESFDAVFGVNVRGTFFTVQKLLPLLSDGASIVLIGSGAAEKGDPGTTIYAASKAALRSFARTWTTDLKERGIRVNVLSPAAIDTPAFANLPPGFRDQIASLVPLGRLGAEREIATAALFLASVDSSFVSGIDLPVDGGIGQV